MSSLIPPMNFNESISIGERIAIGLGRRKKARSFVNGLNDDVLKNVDRLAKIELLVKSAQKGDAEAFAGVYDCFVDQIYRYVYFRVPKEDAEDVTEMVFLKAWEKLKQYKSGKKSFSAWVFRIAHNLIVDSYRFKKDRDFSELTPDIPEYRREHNPINMTESSIHADKLLIALSKMKKNYKQVVILKFINELSNAEIAQILKKNEGSVRILQFRALKILKKELQELGVDFV